MAGYLDTRQLIINTLTNRPAGTEIQPEDHQAFALQITDYIRAVELVAGNATPIGFAEASTVPVEPENGQAVYLSQVNRGTSVTFTYFLDENNQPITVSADTNTVKFVTLLWNGSYWSVQTTSVSATVLTAETLRVTITESSGSYSTSDSSSVIKTAFDAGKYVYAVLGTELLPLIECASSSSAIFQGETKRIEVASSAVTVISANNYYLNVNILKSSAGQPHAAYTSVNAARADVPLAYRKVGLEITYLFEDSTTHETKWLKDQYIGSDISGWGTTSNWQVIGPVSVSQKTGKTELLIGDTPALIVDNVPTVDSNNIIKSGGTSLFARKGFNNLQLQTFGKIELNDNVGAGQHILTKGLTLKDGLTYTFNGIASAARTSNDYLFIKDSEGNTLHYDVIIATNQTSRTITWTPSQTYDNVQISYYNNTYGNIDFSLIITAPTGKNIENLVANIIPSSWQYMGVAIPSTPSPNISNGKLFYIAMSEGLYANLGNIRLVKGEVAILMCDNGVWSKTPTSIINNEMREDGATLMSLGYVKNNFSINGYVNVFKNLTLKAGITYTLKGSFLSAITTYDSYYAIYDKNGNTIKGTAVFVAKGATDGIRTFTVNEDYEGAYIRVFYNTPLIDNFLSVELRQSTSITPEGVVLKIAIPDMVYAVEDVELNLYNDAISFAMVKGLASPSNYVVYWNCQKGTITDRCYRFTPNAEDVGNTYYCTCTLYNMSGAIIDTKIFSIKVLAKDGIASAKRIVFFGDSLGANTAASLRSNFSNPNIFSGVIPTMLGTRSIGDLHFEAVGGYRWMDYATSGRYAYRLEVAGVTTIGLGATYSITIDGTTTNLLVREVNITEGTGNILVESQYGYSIASFPTTGTLTLVSGAGDSTVNFTNGHLESGNPLWNSVTNELDVALYRDRLGLTANEKIDAVAFQFGLNDAFDVATITGYITDLYNAFIADNADCKFIVGISPISGNDFNGYGANYGASGNPIAQNVKMYNFQKLYISLMSANFSNMIISAAGIGVDRWYGYGFSTRHVSSRNNTEEQYHNNFVHPITSGYNQLGDAYLAAFIEALS